jgi:hypothetical protein
MSPPLFANPRAGRNRSHVDAEGVCTTATRGEAEIAHQGPGPIGRTGGGRQRHAGSGLYALRREIAAPSARRESASILGSSIVSLSRSYRLG